MKLKKGGVRGSNRISKALNKPIEGKLAEKKSPKFIIVFFFVLFLILLLFSINEFGLEAGIYFALGFAACVIVLYSHSEHQRKEVEKIVKKHPWKAFK